MINVIEKEKLIRKLLIHKHITEIRGLGLMLSIILKDSSLATKLVLNAKENGLILFFLLIEKKAVRITPPLSISKSEIKHGCEIILDVLDKI